MGDSSHAFRLMSQDNLEQCLHALQQISLEIQYMLSVSDTDTFNIH